MFISHREALIHTSLKIRNQNDLSVMKDKWRNRVWRVYCWLTRETYLSIENLCFTGSHQLIQSQTLGFYLNLYRCCKDYIKTSRQRSYMLCQSNLILVPFKALCSVLPNQHVKYYSFVEHISWRMNKLKLLQNLQYNESCCCIFQSFVEIKPHLDSLEHKHRVWFGLRLLVLS